MGEEEEGSRELGRALVIGDVYYRQKKALEISVCIVDSKVCVCVLFVCLFVWLIG